MVATDSRGVSALVESSAIKGNNCKRPDSTDLSWELMKKKSSFGKMHLHNLEREQMSEMKWGTNRCSIQKKKAEKIAIGVDELCLASDKPQKCKRVSRSRTPGYQKCKILKSGSVSSLGSCCSSSATSRSDSVSSSASSRSGSMSSSSCSRSSSVSSSCSSRSSSVSSSGSSQSDSMSSSGSSRSSSVSSSGSSYLGSVSSLKRYRSSSKYTNSASRSRCASREKRYKRSRGTHSRSRSRSCSRSCYRRSRYHMSYRSPLRYRSRSRSSLRYRRSRSGSRSRFSSKRPRNYHSFMYRTHSSHRSRSRSRGRSIHLTQKDKNTLLEIAKANADKLFGKSSIQMPPSLKPTNPFRDENYNFEKSNIDAAKEMIRRKQANEDEEDEPVQKLGSAPSRSETNHWIAFSVKNAVAKPLNQRSPSGPVKGSPENKQKRSPYGQWIPVQSGHKSGGRTKTQ
ncbi:arginine/serine-rich protein 1 isoform X1 [Mobula hypostoma]|uniref:arginine/serine-rich protein 1 isoform X1 n=1 Tax=Mobula hypostoma TaxID=723540 RepID=UPI002FC3CC8B